MNDESKSPEDQSDMIAALPHLIFGNTLALVSFMDFMIDHASLPRETVVSRLSSDAKAYLRLGFGKHAAYQVEQVADVLKDKPLLDTSDKVASDILKRMMK